MPLCTAPITVGVIIGAAAVVVLIVLLVIAIKCYLHNKKAGEFFFLIEQFLAFIDMYSITGFSCLSPSDCKPASQSQQNKVNHVYNFVVNYPIYSYIACLNVLFLFYMCVY